MNATNFAVPPVLTTVTIAGESRRFPVRRVYCVGRNYIAHIREMKEADERDPPFFFQKPADAVIEAAHGVAYPPHTDDFQYEVELVIAIGRANDGEVTDPLAHVLGYAIGIDLTRRDRQREARAAGLPWEVGKSFDESAPCSEIRKVEDIGHPSAGAIRLFVNDDLKQQGDLSQMIWSVPDIIVKLATQYSLRPGDLIFTGTPAGVGSLRPGDTMRAEIDGVGSLSVRVNGAR